jgi:hypothetical protein
LGRQQINARGKIKGKAGITRAERLQSNPKLLRTSFRRVRRPLAIASKCERPSSMAAAAKM